MSTRTRAWAAAALVALVGMVLAGCSLIAGGQTPRDPSGTPTATAKVSAFDIRVGDCLDDATVGTATATTQIVPCTGPHDSEAFAEFTVTGDKYPGDDKLQAQAQSDCGGTAFAQFVGIASSDSNLQVSYYLPTSDTWAGGDRKITCTIYQMDEAGKPLQTTGTLKNAAR
jgi:hypothetical protein